MIYKKIRDKVPSLSSLLLAGMLSPFGGCESCTKDSKAANESNQNQNPLPVDDKKGKEDGSKSLDKDFVDVVKDIFKYLTSNVLMLDRMDKGPEVFDEAEFSGPAASGNLESLCKSFISASSAKIYPSSLEKTFASLPNIKFRTGGSMSGEPHKYAWGVALNAIAGIWNNFHITWKKFQDLIDKGAPEEQIKNLLDEFTGYYNQTVVGSKSIFTEKNKFFDSKECKWLGEDRLARFLSGKDKKVDKDGKPLDKPTTKQFGMPGLLSLKVGQSDKSTKKIIKVWVMGKVNKADFISEDAESLKNITQRGAPIPSSANVMGLAPMPEIEAFPVSEKITHKFVKDAVATSGGDRNDAPFGVEITNGQLLNTLFKGDNKSVDFMRFYFDDKTEASPYFFKIQSSNDAFQSVLNLAKNDQDTAKFATMLGHHITDAQTGLENLIFIPDRLEIQNDILKNIGDSKSVGEKKQANEEGKPISNYEEFSKDGFDPIGGGSIAGRLFVNLARILGYDSSDPNTAFNKCMIHITDANIDVSDATINQKIAIEILKSLLDKGKPFIQPATKEFVITSDSEGSAKKLIESVEGTIKSQVEKAVVYREGNLFFGTPVTEHIMRFIREMGNALSEKHGDAHITYKTISDVTNKAFKIADVIKAAEADFKDIRSAMRAKVSSFLNDKESLSLENYSTYFPDVSLRSAHITQFNQLKSEYINKNKDKKLSPDI